MQEAKDAALDELGVDEAEAEFEVLAEAQTGLFGRLRSEARVRARVRPTAPRAKEDRRGRERRRRSNAREAGNGETKQPADEASTALTSPGPAPDDETDSESASVSDDEVPAAAGEGGGSNRRRRNRRRGGSRPGEPPSRRQVASTEEGDYDDDRSTKGSEVDVDLDRQAEVAADFLTKLTAEFGLEADVAVTRPDEDTVEIQLTGSDLGILIGPKGATLLAIQNLTRTVVFNETGGNNGHINVDVGGYRQKRTEALVRFAQQVAEQVKTSGNRTVLEPMSAVDRKVVHDTISTIDGVNTVSEGEEPRRRVVVLPG